ncbi:MAG: phosphatase PAP2 family protein [Bacteroidetes bacterium]|nr:phosphatase PAP2 family protein [Bacteroidota bacterium]
MLETLKSIDQGLFLFLNGLHTPFFDAIMFWGTNSLTWLPLYVLMLYLVIRRYKWQAIWIVLFAILMIIVSDQLSNFFKDFIERPRPTYEPGLKGVHTVNGYLGGQHGFYSAHASTNLAIAVYLIILLERPFRFFPMLMLIWAIFISYTRIYLGVHYPGDILAGWIAGGLIGWGFGQLCGWFIRKPV